MAEHRYRVSVEWTGNRGEGTAGYRSYGREHVVRCEHGLTLEGSADRSFHGDAGRWNPEELLLAALSQCHMLSYLHAAAASGIVVVSYQDDAEAVLQQQGSGGRFAGAVLRPRVTIASGEPALAAALHERAAADCFIAASVNFPIRHEPTVVTATEPAEGDAP